MNEPHVLSIPASGFQVEIIDSQVVNLTDNRPNVSWVISREKGSGLICYGRLKSEGEPINLLQNGILIEDHLKQMLNNTLSAHYRNLGTFYDVKLLSFNLPIITKPLGREKILRDETRFFLRAVGRNPTIFSLDNGFSLRHYQLKEDLSPHEVQVLIDTDGLLPVVTLVLTCPLEMHTLKRLHHKQELEYQARYIFDWFSDYITVYQVSCMALTEESITHETVVYRRAEM